MMGKLQEAQQKTEEVKKRLADLVIKEDSEDITILISGNREIKDIVLADSLLQDKEELQDKLVLALNRAIQKADDTYEQEMQLIAQGMMPGTDMFE